MSNVKESTANLAKIREILEKTFHIEQIEEIHPDAHLISLGLNSLDLLKFVSELEKAIGRKISDEQMTLILTVGDALKIMEKSA